MNKKEYQIWKNKWMQKLDRDGRKFVNCIRIGSESREHASMKFKYVMDNLLGGKTDYITECLDFKRLFRADMIVFSIPTPAVIEFAVSEGDESLERKESYWNKLGFNFEVRRG